MDESRDQITRILSDAATREKRTADLLPILYGELRAMAGQFMRFERGHHTLQATALVHEAFLRLVDNGCAPDAARGEFLAAAASAMRRILIDHARRVGAEKRGGGWERVTLAELFGQDYDDIDVLALNAALEKLGVLDPRQARIVEMRFFSGMTGQEIADHLGISRNTVVRELKMARAWLHRELEP